MQDHCSPCLYILLACLVMVTLSTSRHLQDPPSQLGAGQGAGKGNV